jgi:hypothetical protein
LAITMVVAQVWTTQWLTVAMRSGNRLMLMPLMPSNPWTV